MEGSAKYFVQAGEKYNIDPLFLAAIAYHESKYAKAYGFNDERHTFAGVMAWTNGKRHLKRYDSYEDAIFDHARIVREVYINNGKDTIVEVWATYAPLFENTNSSWGPTVAKKYAQLRVRLNLI